MLRLKLQYFGHLMPKELTHWKRPWCWEGLGTGGEGDDRGWDGWMASPSQWAWVWVNSRSWWWTGRPGVLQFMGSQRVRHNWATELNWTFRENRRNPWGLTSSPFSNISALKQEHGVVVSAAVKQTTPITKNLRQGNLFWLEDHGSKRTRQIYFAWFLSLSVILSLESQYRYGKFLTNEGK